MELRIFSLQRRGHSARSDQRKQRQTFGRVFIRERNRRTIAKAVYTRSGNGKCNAFKKHNESYQGHYVRFIERAETDGGKKL